MERIRSQLPLELWTLICEYIPPQDYNVLFQSIPAIIGPILSLAKYRQRHALHCHIIPSQQSRLMDWLIRTKYASDRKQLSCKYDGLDLEDMDFRRLAAREFVLLYQPAFSSLESNVNIAQRTVSMLALGIQEDSVITMQIQEEFKSEFKAAIGDINANVSTENDVFTDHQIPPLFEWENSDDNDGDESEQQLAIIYRRRPRVLQSLESLTILRLLLDAGISKAYLQYPLAYHYAHQHTEIVKILCNKFGGDMQAVKRRIDDPRQFRNPWFDHPRSAGDEIDSQFQFMLHSNQMTSLPLIEDCLMRGADINAGSVEDEFALQWFIGHLARSDDDNSKEDLHAEDWIRIRSLRLSLLLRYGLQLNFNTEMYFLIQREEGWPGMLRLLLQWDALGDRLELFRLGLKHNHLELLRAMLMHYSGDLKFLIQRSGGERRLIEVMKQDNDYYEDDRFGESLMHLLKCYGYTINRQAEVAKVSSTLTVFRNQRK